MLPNDLIFSQANVRHTYARYLVYATLFISVCCYPLTLWAAPHKHDKIARFIGFLEKSDTKSFFNALSTHDNVYEILSAIPADLLNEKEYEVYNRERGSLLLGLVLQTFTEGSLYEDMLEELVKVPGIDINVRSPGTSSTALMWAAEQAGGKSSVRAVEILLQAGADVNLRNQHGATALMYALKAQFSDTLSKEIVQAILEKDPDLTDDDQGDQSTLYNVIDKANTFWDVFQNHITKKQQNVSTFLAEYLPYAVRKNLRTHITFVLGKLESEYKAGHIDTKTLTNIGKLTEKDSVIAAWYYHKRHGVILKRNRAAFIRKLQVWIARHQNAQAAAPEDSPERDCAVCCAAPGTTRLNAAAEPVCGPCVAKWYNEQGTLSGLGLVLDDKALRERGDQITVQDLCALGLSDEEILEIEIDRLRPQLKSTAGWRFCSTADCFNGKVVEGEGADLYFECELCERKSCLGCGDDHKGSCDKEERTKAEVARLSLLGRKRPNPGQADSEDGKFRPCYFCGILTERIDGCSTMRCASCLKNWDWNYGDPTTHPRYAGEQVHDFAAEEQHYEPKIPAHL